MWSRTRFSQGGGATRSSGASRCRGCSGSPAARRPTTCAGSSRRNALHQRLSAENTHHRAESKRHSDWPLGADPSLAAALATLSERDREALMLVAWDGLAHDVAASVMGCSTGAFTVRIHRARRKLERALADDESDAVEITPEARSSP
jgi:predicted DNA-binding protein (UPF0251 family)